MLHVRVWVAVLLMFDIDVCVNWCMLASARIIVKDFEQNSIGIDS